jgi:two-component system, OmpR family, sensor histidine kinase PhoQ
VHSLSQRLLISVSIPLAVFFGAMMMVLDRGFRELGDRSLQQLLDSQMVALIAAAEPQPDGKYAPESNDLAARMRTPRSGLYAQIVSSKNKEPWRSPSAAGSSIDFGPTRAPGVRDISYGDNSHERIEIESRGIEFEDRTGHVELTFSVAASLTPYEQQLWAFRRQLFGWFSGLMLLLLAALAGVLRWVLSPVRRMEREIRAVEEGRSDALGAGYPRELSGVATNLNTLLIGERKRVTRYRDTLGNLAHSLKTPLAVMRAAITSNTGVSEGVLNPEIDKMSAIIEHQLKRAAASGGALLGQAPVEVGPIVSELRVALLKVYARKDLSVELVVAPACQFIGDRGDLTELLGNVLDNACKWCRSVVRLTVSVDGAVETRQKLSILVEDDGPGISAEDRIRIGQRGVRTDETVPGHGIGLSMVQDTVELYSGTMTISASPALGGAAFEIRLPGR